MMASQPGTTAAGRGRANISTGHGLPAPGRLLMRGRGPARVRWRTIANVAVSLAAVAAAVWTAPALLGGLAIANGDYLDQLISPLWGEPARPSV